MACLIDIVPGLEKAVTAALADSPDVDEYVVVRTCNRLEAYAATEANESVRRRLEATVRQAIPFQEREFWYFLEDQNSVKHLFSVVCGIDSLIVGEDQIQHQVRESFAQAKTAGNVGPVLNALFEEAIVVGKRVRTETDLNKGAVSVGSAAIELAEQRLGPLVGKTVSILGAGDMAGVIAKNLAGKRPNTVFVSNRTFDRAQELARELAGTAVTMDRMDEMISRSDVVLVATSAPHDVVRQVNVAAAMKSRPAKPLLIIDVSVPTNVAADVTSVPGVSLSTMAALDAIAAKNVEKRKNEISAAERIIAQELAKIDRTEKQRRANEAIRRLGQMAEEIRQNEATAAKNRIRNTNADEVIDDLTKAIVKQISAEFIKNLRIAAEQGDTTTCATAEKLFGLTRPTKKE